MVLKHKRSGSGGALDEPPGCHVEDEMEGRLESGDLVRRLLQ